VQRQRSDNWPILLPLMGFLVRLAHAPCVSDSYTKGRRFADFPEISVAEALANPATISILGDGLSAADIAHGPLHVSSGITSAHASVSGRSSIWGLSPNPIQRYTGECIGRNLKGVQARGMIEDL
jgi:hypothetical protein